MNEILSSLVPASNPERVRVFRTSNCGWCVRAEHLLEQHGIRYDSVDVTDDLRARSALVEEAGGRRTVPVVFVDGKAVGGYVELARLVASGGLDHLRQGRGGA